MSWVTKVIHPLVIPVEIFFQLRFLDYPGSLRQWGNKEIYFNNIWCLNMEKYNSFAVPEPNEAKFQTEVEKLGLQIEELSAHGV